MKALPYLLFVFLFYSSCVSTNNRDNADAAAVLDSLNAEVTKVEDYILIVPKDTLNFSSKDGKFQFRIELMGDSTEFTKLYSQYYKKEKESFRIVRIDSILDTLRTRIEIKEIVDSGYVLVSKIHVANGKEVAVNEEFDDYFIVAYYPEYDFLSMEGYHSVEYGYDLTTGEDVFEAGSPIGQTLSPNQKYRISGIYSGQECSSYIIQKKVDGRFSKVADLDHPALCYFIKSFWVNDTTFYYSHHTPKYDSLNGTMEYFRMTIKEK